MTHTGNRCEESAIAVARRNAAAPASLASDTPAPLPAPLPKAPLLEWSGLLPGGSGAMVSVNDLPHRAFTSSGRAALHAALLQMKLPAGSAVLVPTYHCPTMVAPIVAAGMVPRFYALDADGAPDLARIEDDAGLRSRAMFVAHYFGLPRSLRRVRAWCDERDIILVEDCAHSYFGMAGERAVGSWGHYATASLSKFFPIAEGGLFASATQPLDPLGLLRPSARMQLKAAWDVIDVACRYGRFPVLARLVDRFRRSSDALAVDHVGAAAPVELESISEAMHVCDMARIGQASALAALALHRWVATGRMARRRQLNYDQLAQRLGANPAARPMEPALPPGAVPYVLPLWIDDPQQADAVYHRARELNLPVFRWDRHWPGTPQDPADWGTRWSRHVLQLLCHQSLRPQDLDRVAGHLLDALRARA